MYLIVNKISYLIYVEIRNVKKILFNCTYPALTEEFMLASLTTIVVG